MSAQVRDGRLTRRLRLDSPRRRIAHALLASAVALVGLGLATVDGLASPAHVSQLARSGSFYALAASGGTLYAASDNGGSVVLERSADRGVDWTASPVPYSAVAGGAPWTHASVAVDGARIVLAAASGSGTNPPYPAGPLPAPPPPVGLSNSSCSTNSTVFVGSSADGGRTWSTETLGTPNLTVTSLQLGVVGGSEAVAWTGSSSVCGSSGAAAQAITSADGGASWSGVQSLSVPGARLPQGQTLEMAPDSQGIVAAFGASGSNGTESELELWGFVSGSAGFVPAGVLPAPTSWTLQGSSTTPAYLLTPTYLVPLTAPPYTALPFDQLQSDAPSIGTLPTVVSLVPESSGVVEIAATTADNLGVDCWRVDTVQMTVSSACHVSLVTPLVSSAQVLPIVSLIDGGGWWVAVGALGAGCGPGCPVNPGGPSQGPGGGYPAPVAGPAVGTSVCLSGCTSIEGLAAYSFDSASASGQNALALTGVALMLVGVAWLVVVAVARRTARSASVVPQPGRAGSQARVGDGSTPPLDRAAPDGPDMGLDGRD